MQFLQWQAALLGFIPGYFSALAFMKFYNIHGPSPVGFHYWFKFSVYCGFLLEALLLASVVFYFIK